MFACVKGGLEFWRLCRHRARTPAAAARFLFTSRRFSQSLKLVTIANHHRARPRNLGHSSTSYMNVSCPQAAACGSALRAAKWCSASCSAMLTFVSSSCTTNQHPWPQSACQRRRLQLHSAPRGRCHIGDVTTLQRHPPDAGRPRLAQVNAAYDDVLRMPEIHADSTLWSWLFSRGHCVQAIAPDFISVLLVPPYWKRIASSEAASFEPTAVGSDSNCRARCSSLIEGSGSYGSEYGHEVIFVGLFLALFTDGGCTCTSSHRIHLERVRLTNRGSWFRFTQVGDCAPTGHRDCYTMALWCAAFHGRPRDATVFSAALRTTIASSGTALHTLLPAVCDRIWCTPLVRRGAKPRGLISRSRSSSVTVHSSLKSQSSQTVDRPSANDHCTRGCESRPWRPDAERCWRRLSNSQLRRVHLSTTISCFVAPMPSRCLFLQSRE